MSDERDWTRTQFEACPECGADASAVAAVDLGPEVVREVAKWGRVMAAADPHLVRERPAGRAGPGITWSALDYACHVRDLLPVMAARIELMRDEDDPALGWWDHEAAVDADRYDEQVPVLVVEAMTANARAFASLLDTLDEPDWARTGERRPGEHFTVLGIARFVLHEVIHHRDDAVRSLKGVAP